MVTKRLWCDDCGRFVKAEQDDDGVFVCPHCGNDYLEEREDYNEYYEDGDFLRLQEEYAAYQYAGCTESFWEDHNAGYF